MICYKDMTFYAAECGNIECDRFLSEYHSRKAEELSLLVSLCDFSASCNQYERITESSHENQAIQ